MPRVSGPIVLRRLALADLPRFQAYRHDPEVARYQSWEPQTDHEAARFVQDMSQTDLFSEGPPGTWVQLGVARCSTNELIGDVGICVDGGKAEIGFTIARDAQGAGLGTEAVRAVIHLVFEQTNATAIVAVTDARNIPANRLLRRVGMRHAKTNHAVFRGEPCLEHVWMMSRGDRAALVSVPI